MPIILDTVRISGFRGIRNLEMSLPRFAVLIGPNNCGKTSVLKSLQLALGDYGRQLSDEDFHIDSHDRRTEEIIIDVRIIPTGNGGERVRNFSRRWINKFGDNIQADPSGDQFIAFRTAARRQKTPRAGFLIERHTLRVWSGFADWPSSVPDLSSRYTLNSRSIPFVAIDAQRDIHRELSQKSSFVGRVLSQVEYSEEDVDELERLIAEINSKAVSKSEPLAKLMEHLNALRVSFGGIGGVEVMPVPKKLRDLSKNFSVHFGDSAAGLFPMEYHGMGTRSWASMLAVRAFTELAEELLVEETEPYHPIIAAEEPEAHLHPNAQRSLFSQLSETNGQVVVSTHSPYLAAMCPLADLRSLSAHNGGIQCYATEGLSGEEAAMLHRVVMRNKGEALFARAIILFEGQTEEQVTPVFFEQWFGATAFSRGVNLTAVNGRGYVPYIKLAMSLGIPVAIVSDNDGEKSNSTKCMVDRQIAGIKSAMGQSTLENWLFVDYLTGGHDFEAEIVKACGLTDEIIDAFVEKAREADSSPRHLEKTRHDLEALTEDELIEKMRKSKTRYSGFLSDVLARNPRSKSREDIVPEAFQRAFSKVEGWLQ